LQFEVGNVIVKLADKTLDPLIGAFGSLDPAAKPLPFVRRSSLWTSIELARGSRALVVGGSGRGCELATERAKFLTLSGSVSVISQNATLQVAFTAKEGRSP
jgi:hypothetical protein